jgi:hypothetical protein
MHKKKYLKYKKKYIDFKLQIGGIEHYIDYDTSNKLTPLKCKDDPEKSYIDNLKLTIYLRKAKYDNIYFNVALRIYNIEKVLCLLQKNFFNFFNFDNIDLLSIGSGNGLFESLCQQIFGIPILCVDPYPLDFMRFKLKKPFIKPMFNYTVNYLESEKKKDETVLFLIWPNNLSEEEEEEDVIPYDLEAILLLKPLAFFIIYSNRGFIAGSRQLRKLIIPKNIFKVGHQIYKKKLQRNVRVMIKGPSVISLGDEAIINIALFVNDSKYQLFEDDRSKFYKPQFIENYDEVDEEIIELGYYNPDVA